MSKVVKMEEKYCQCSDVAPITWFDTCEVCGKRYMFPGRRKTVIHQQPYKYGEKLLIDFCEESKRRRGYISTEHGDWYELSHKLLDAGFVSIYGGYFLMGYGLFCNPRLCTDVELYFTDKRGAKLWKKLDYSGALYAVEVCYKRPKSK